MKLQNLLNGLFIFLMLFETIYALATNDLSLLSDHFKTYINDLSPVNIFNTIMGFLGNWSFTYGHSPLSFTINLNFLRDFIAYLIFLPYYIANAVYVLFSVIYYLFVILYYPFAILPSPFNSIFEAGVTGIIVISIVTEIRIMSTSLGGGN